ncbi:tryptophan synthase beta subunit-like PLP-dependent enzyme [Neurospora hispaniola]|uniref:Tryptophan synthase beta subunit-like PLP-dependent enzyme n=1 Tax=Neurospora hispaniola TaxID=588809 RepID=A0AAJ0IF22_9PEZI|nr:tryptophan synthase beta subunit-like PLP-dependent enzyme [Neurospora hispaniola]
MADPSTTLPLTRASVLAAHSLIKSYIHETPVLTNTTLDQLASTPRTPEELRGTEWEATERPANPKIRFWFKCENFQRIGAFKARGAFHAVERLKQTEGLEGLRKGGVVTHSSGNHAQALSLAARENGIPAHIVMPTISPPPKIAATKGYGANITFSGSTSTEREAVTREVIEKTGARLVPPYDHPDIILGQGTAALELQRQVAASLSTSGTTNRRLNAIISPCGGGGLLSGTALACSDLSPSDPSTPGPILVFGAEPSFSGADDGRRGYYSGTRIESVKSLTIADGLRTPLGAYPWSIIYERKLVAGMYSVGEEEIKKALRLVYERMKVVAEPSAVVGLAVALFNEEFRSMVEREGGEEGWDLGVLFSGGNVELAALGRLFGEE